jgi:hypothetical protein
VLLTLQNFEEFKPSEPVQDGIGQLLRCSIRGYAGRFSDQVQLHIIPNCSKIASSFKISFRGRCSEGELVVERDLRLLNQSMAPVFVAHALRHDATSSALSDLSLQSGGSSWCTSCDTVGSNLECDQAMAHPALAGKDLHPRRKSARPFPVVPVVPGGTCTCTCTCSSMDSTDAANSTTVQNKIGLVSPWLPETAHKCIYGACGSGHMYGGRLIRV